MDKIVIIEDDPGIRTVLRIALKGAGYASFTKPTAATRALHWSCTNSQHSCCWT